MATDFDIGLNGKKYRLRRQGSGEGAPYIRRAVRAEFSAHSTVTGQGQSRADRHALYQTSWSGGSRWWKPLIGPTESDTYYYSENIDAFSTPGMLLPMNELKETVWAREAFEAIHENMVVAPHPLGQKLVAVGANAITTSGVYWDMIDIAGEARTASSVSFFVPGDQTPLSLIYDPSDDHFYCLTVTGISRIDLANDSDVDWIASHGIPMGTFGPRKTFLRAGGVLMIYNGDRISSVNKGAPDIDASPIYDDGMGPDALSWMHVKYDYDEDDIQPQHLVNPQTINLIQSTPEGIFYVKNVDEGGATTPWVFRVHRDASGAWIGSPIATLPRGLAATGLHYHLGSVVITAGPAQEVKANQAPWRTEIYAINGDSLSPLGSPEGPQATEAIMPITSYGNLLYFVGIKSGYAGRLWVYDAAQGGLHQAGSFYGSDIPVPNGGEG